MLVSWQHIAGRSTGRLTSKSSGLGPDTSQAVNEVVPSVVQLAPLSVEKKNSTYSVEPLVQIPPE